MRKNRGRWGRRFIDVGANWGSYTVLLGPRFDRVDAFEPLARRAAALQYYASSSGCAVDVHACALSDRNAGVPFLAPENEIVDLSGSARVVESAHPAAITIGARTLDSFSFDDIDFVRIGVDGHERSVIAGASATLRKCRPTLLVEMEQRHFDEPLGERIEFIERFGYRASFLRDGRSCEATELLVTRDQNAANLGKRRYINSFLFEPC
jgi:FkbM family methyltransferase